MQKKGGGGNFKIIHPCSKIIFSSSYDWNFASKLKTEKKIFLNWLSVKHSTTALIYLFYFLMSFESYIYDAR